MAEDLQAEAQSDLTLQESSPGQKGQKIKDRGQWVNKWEFLLAVAGQIVGLGNLWRFPYLCYKNGGGAFLIPYVLFMLTGGIPLFILETAVGQYTSLGGTACWRKICPLFEGIGSCTFVMVLYGGTTYIIVLAWAFFYLFSSFSSELPWASCGHTWNTDACVEFEEQNHTSNCTDPIRATSAVQEFWERRVLGVSRGIDLTWELALCLLLSWIVCYFCVWKGVKSTGKSHSPGLVFITYPWVVAMMPLPQLWSVCFFIMVILLAVDSQVSLSLLLMAIVDSFPSALRRGYRRELLLLLLCAVCFLIGLLMLTEVRGQGGEYVFHLVEYYACNGVSVLLIAVSQTTCIAWVYGANLFYRNIEDMIGYRPWPLVGYCWLYITPAVCTSTFIYSLVRSSPLKYNNTYVYPGWAYVLGWCLTLSSAVCVPVWMVFKLSQTPGTLCQRLRLLCRPSQDLPLARKQKGDYSILSYDPVALSPDERQRETAARPGAPDLDTSVC
ncbi:sodium- and chloride-dependent GABA transporter 2-like [Amia ocellicauda]|uniref:sodium- and chloride-dependent GABA transporter 2-like n=1 Tax=Amia ocellicauda TaxID=2972642 RepID=UPI0034640970